MESLNILLIDDDEEEFILVKELLLGIKNRSFAVEWTGAYDSGFEALLREDQPDVCLVDYQLGHRNGVELVREALSHGISTPMILLTGQGSRQVDIEAMEAGAEDYLLKNELTAPLLERSIRYAIERRKLREQLEQSRQRQNEEREMNSLRRFSSASATSVSGRAFGLVPLREAHASGFEELLQTYQKLISQKLEEHVFRVDNGIPNQLRDMADRLGYLGAGPRDVVDLHASTLENLSRSETREKYQAGIEEGRRLVFELMGYLVSYYKKYSMSAPRPKPSIETES